VSLRLDNRKVRSSRTGGRSRLDVGNDRSDLASSIPGTPLQDERAIEGSEGIVNRVSAGKEQRLPDMPEHNRSVVGNHEPDSRDATIYDESNRFAFESMMPQRAELPTEVEHQMASSLPELPDRLAVYVDSMVTTGGASSISIQLEPKHLGKIKFRILLRGNKISANLSVDRAGTREMIELQLPDIKRNLAEHKIEVVELSVSLENETSESESRYSRQFRDDTDANPSVIHQRNRESEDIGGQIRELLPQRYVAKDALVDLFV
jgi:flagellar hook-length control protein FliK